MRLAAADMKQKKTTRLDCFLRNIYKLVLCAFLSNNVKKKVIEKNVSALYLTERCIFITLDAVKHNPLAHVNNP